MAVGAAVVGAAAAGDVVDGAGDVVVGVVAAGAAEAGDERSM